MNRYVETAEEKGDSQVSCCTRWMNRRGGWSCGRGSQRRRIGYTICSYVADENGYYLSRMRVQHGIRGLLGPLCTEQSSACFVQYPFSAPRMCVCCCDEQHIQAEAAAAAATTITITIIVRWKLLFSPITAIICVCTSSSAPSHRREQRQTIHIYSLWRIKWTQSFNHSSSNSSIHLFFFFSFMPTHRTVTTSTFPPLLLNNIIIIVRKQSNYSIYEFQ